MKRFLKTVTVLILLLSMSVMPVTAAYGGGTGSVIRPMSNYISTASVSIAFDSNYKAYCSLVVTGKDGISGVSGLMKLFEGDSTDGTCLEVWSVSDYVQPIGAEFTYQCEQGKTYTVQFVGYCYGKTGLTPDRMDMTSTATAGK